MTKIIALSICLLFVSTIFCAPPLSDDAKQQFIQRICLDAKTNNQKIYQLRKKILALYQRYQQKQLPNQSEKTWLHQLGQRYGVSFYPHPDESTWQQLLARIDIIPISLTIAQAINESAWGTSRFARKGNNYFGQWCYRPGCGLIPKQRPAGLAHFVRKFSSMQASVNSYMANLNTHATYQSFRRARTDLRRYSKPVLGTALVKGLSGYSTKRQAYVRAIRNIILGFNLERFDKAPWNYPPNSGEHHEITC